MASAFVPRMTAPRPTSVAKPAVLLLLPAALAIAGCGPSRQEIAAEQRATLARYCFDCHDDVERTADLSLESLDVADVGAAAATWEHVVRKLETGMMPPHDGAPRPQPAESAALVAWLVGELDRSAAESPDPGRTVPFHRLNRNEYRNAVRDLLAVDVDVASLLPGDDASYGFDNIGGVLKLSPTLLERYLSAADKISRLAVGTASPFVTIDSFRVPDDRSQERRLPGMPVYTEPQILEISIDRERVATFTLDAATALPLRPEDADDFGGRMNRRVAREEQQARNRADENWSVRVPVAAGRREVAVAFLDKAASVPTGKREPFLRPFPRGLNIPEGRYGSYLRYVEIGGPFEAAGPGQTASRERIFVCRPATEQPMPTAEAE